jgi:hypothetical protein
MSEPEYSAQSMSKDDFEVNPIALRIITECSDDDVRIWKKVYEAYEGDAGDETDGLEHCV